MPLAQARNLSLKAVRVSGVHTGNCSTQSKYFCSACSSVALHTFIDVVHAFTSKLGPGRVSCAMHAA